MLDVWIGRYWEGETITEIAASMGVSKQAMPKTMQGGVVKTKGKFDQRYAAKTGYRGKGNSQHFRVD